MATLADLMGIGLRPVGTFTKKEFFESLGEFIDAYARAEGMTHTFFIFVSRITPSVAQAITGDMSLRDLVAPIKKIAKIHKFDDENIKEIDYIFQQFNHIAQFRHRLIHRSADLHEGKLKSTNLFSMKAMEDYEVLTFSLEDIESATRDLAIIFLRLYYLSEPDKTPQDNELLEGIRKPWRYKPLKPETPNRPLRPKSKPRKRPPRPSPA